MRHATILFFMLLSINVCTLYSAETSPDASQSHHVSPTDVVLTNNMMQRLYNGETISHNGNMEIKADNLEAFKSVFPSTIQIVSKSTFISRIRFMRETLVGETDDFKTLKAEYCIDQDTLGYGPFSFALLLKLYSKTDTSEEPVGADGVYATRALGNSAQLPFLKNALQPTMFYSLMHQHLTREFPAIEASKEIDYFGCGTTPVYYTFTDKNGILNIIASPCHDLEEGSDPLKEAQSGGLSVMKMVNSVSALLKDVNKPYRLLIPIAQANGTRGHWTLLCITKTGVNHYDSTGPRSLHYNLSNIEDAAKKITSAKMKCFYLGHQGTFNQKDCGLFVISYIALLLQNIQLSQVATNDMHRMFATFDLNAKQSNCTEPTEEAEGDVDCAWDEE